MPQKRLGFSLIEVIIFVSLISILFVGAASVMSFMYRQNQMQISQLIATHQSEELYQWLKAEREADWNTFVNTVTVGKTQQSTLFCFSTLDPTWGSQIGDLSGCPYAISSKYRRSATFQVDNLANPTQVSVRISTDWIEASSVRSKVFTVVFINQWE